MTDHAEGEHAGFRELVEGLLEANLARDPGRAHLITRREAVALLATDAGLAVTIQLLPGAAGGVGTVVVHAASIGLLELAATPLRFGLPDVLHPEGRTVVRDLLARRIRVQGLVRHLWTLRRISRLLSAR